MTAENFQSVLAEIVAGLTVDPQRLEGLTTLERQRLQAVSKQAGTDVMRTLYSSWRLTKILSLLPLTAALLGNERLAYCLRSFWSERKATSLYFVEECLTFLSFLENTLDESLPHMQEVMAFERARLELRFELSKGSTPGPREVRFHCDPPALFEALGKGGNLPDLPALDIMLQGSLTSDGQEHWAVVRKA